MTTEKKLRALVSVGDVGIYRVSDGGWGVSLRFYDNSYYLAHPANSIKEAVAEMYKEWRVQASLQRPEWNLKAYKKYLAGLEEVTPLIDRIPNE